VRRLQGHIDIPLNAEGERQAGALALALADTPVDAIYASDLQRARQTAQAVASTLGLPLGADAGLRERCYGGFEGLLYSEIEARFPADFAAWQARDVDAVMPPGVRVAESFRQFYARCIDTIVALASRHPGQQLVLVAHGGVLECAYRAAMGIELGTPRTFPIKNASINRFAFQGGVLSMSSWGETAHLQPRALDELA
jgi:probable phosphoglycerate mutase